MRVQTIKDILISIFSGFSIGWLFVSVFVPILWFFFIMFLSLILKQFGVDIENTVVFFPVNFFFLSEEPEMIEKIIKYIGVSVVMSILFYVNFSEMRKVTE